MTKDTKTPCIVHLIFGLSQGGAEQSLKRLVINSGDEHKVVCLGPVSTIGQAISAAGIEIHYCPPWNIVRLVRLVRALRPDVVQGWMYYGNFFASLMRAISGGSWRTAWNLRSAYRPAEMPPRIRAVFGLSRWLPRDLVICNSFAGQMSHELKNDPIVVIANGVDTQKYRPDSQARNRLRDQLGIGEAGRLIGLVSRYHADKGLVEFLSLQNELGPEHRLVLIGRGMDAGNPALALDAERAGINLENVLCLGEREDLHQLYSALDLLVVASYREGSPNVLMEAMACGVAVVGTDVGDVATIIDDPERVCVSRDAGALAVVVRYVLRHPGQFSQQDRQRVVERYDSARCISAYEDIYRLLLSRC